MQHSNLNRDAEAAIEATETPAIVAAAAAATTDSNVLIAVAVVPVATGAETLTGAAIWATATPTNAATTTAATRAAATCAAVRAATLANRHGTVRTRTVCRRPDAVSSTGPALVGTIVCNAAVAAVQCAHRSSAD